MRKTILTILFALTAVLSSQEKYDLKSTFIKGEKYLVNFKTDQNITQTIGNNKLNTQQTQATTYIYEVVMLDDKGNAHLKYTYQEAAIIIKSDNAGMNVDYNSKRDGLEKVPPAALGLSALVGQSFTVVISSESKVVEVKGMDKLVELMLKKVSTAVPQMMQKQM